MKTASPAFRLELLIVPIPLLLPLERENLESSSPFSFSEMIIDMHFIFLQIQSCHNRENRASLLHLFLSYCCNPTSLRENKNHPNERKAVKMSSLWRCFYNFRGVKLPVLSSSNESVKTYLKLKAEKWLSCSTAVDC